MGAKETETRPPAVERVGRIEPAAQPVNWPAKHGMKSRCAVSYMAHRPESARSTVGIAVFLWTAFGVGTVAFAQTGPLIDAQTWQGGVGVAQGGTTLLMNTDADVDLETYPIIPQVLADNSVDVEFRISPNGTILYARAFGSALTGLCSPTMNQIYFFNIVQDDDASGHLETIFNGGLCTNGPVPDHDGLYELPGQFQHVAYLVEPKDSPIAARQSVHWINLNGVDESGSTELNVDVDGLFFDFTPDGFAVLVKHGIVQPPNTADYTLIDLCPSPRLGDSITSDIGGDLFGLPNPEPSASVVEEPPGSGDFVVRITHPDVGAGGVLDVPLTPCAGTPDTGACCNEGSCVETSAAGCAGTYQGDGTVCPHPECSSTGACCNDGVCTVTTSAACGGVYVGDATNCPNPACLLKANMSVSKGDNPDPVTAGEHLDYNLEVANAGPDDATDVVVIDTLPPGVTFDPATSSPQCEEFGGIVTCDMGDMANGLVDPITIGVTVDPSTRQMITNTAVVEARELDLDPENNLAAQSTTVIASADLSITKVGNPDPVCPGGILVHEIDVTNLGPSNATNVTITDSLPPGVFLVDGEGNSTGETMVACGDDVIAPGESLSLTVVTIVDDGVVPGTLLFNLAEANATEPDPDPNNSVALDATTVSPPCENPIERFQLIADTAVTPIPGGVGEFSSFDAPVVSGSAVAFSASGLGQEGVYRWVDGVLVRVADQSTPVPGGHGSFFMLANLGDTPSIDGLNVAFHGIGPGPAPVPFAIYQEGIYRTDACGLRLGVDQHDENPTFPGEGFYSFFGPRIRNDSIAFYGGGWVPDGIYLWDGSTMEIVADGNTPFPGGGGDFTVFGTPVFDGTNIAFWGGGGGLVKGVREFPGIYNWSGGPVTTVADKTTPIPGGTGTFVGFRTRPSAGSGQVAFIGIGELPFVGAYLYDIGTDSLHVVADSSMPIPGQDTDFWGFFELSVSDGRVAFFAQGLGGVPQGLFLYEKGFVRPILISGQMLDGRAVFVTDFAQEGLSGHRLVFSVLYLISPSPLVFGEAVYLATVPLFADPDGDGDVDHDDSATFVSCMAGPNVLPDPPQQTTVQECLDAFDGDMENDVDLADFAKLQMAFSGE